MEDVKEFAATDVVKMNNCYDYELHFYSIVAKKDFLIPAFAEKYEIPVEVVKSEILNKNFYFTGLDKWGNHAPLKICDPAMYYFLFGREDKTRHICKEFFTEILGIDDESAFNKAVMFELIRTRTEARLCKKYMDELDDLEDWKKNILLSRYKYYANEEEK